MRKALTATTLLFALTLAGGAFAAGTGPGDALGYGSTKAERGHEVTVHIPSFVILRIAGGASSAVVDFNPTGNDVANGNTVQPDSATSTFTGLLGFTNASSAVTVSAKIASNATGLSGTALTADQAVMGDVQVNGTALSGTYASISKTISAYSFSTTRGFQQILALSDFSLHLTGTEAQGNYSYTITYSATAP